jgi:hypothetical protein
MRHNGSAAFSELAAVSLYPQYPYSEAECRSRFWNSARASGRDLGFYGSAAPTTIERGAD